MEKSIRILNNLVEDDVAVLAKECGYKWPCNYRLTIYNVTQEHDNPSFRMTKGEREYAKEYMVNGHDVIDFTNDSYVQYGIPTIGALRHWLADAHNIHVSYIHDNELKGFEHKFMSKIDMDTTKLFEVTHCSYGDGITDILKQILNTLIKNNKT